MLTYSLIRHLIDLASRDSPKEMCGLLCQGEVFHYCENKSITPERSFLIDIQDFDAIRDQNVCALVHSHPDKNAAPSQPDCRLMDAFQHIGMPMDFIIIGLKPVEIRCFRKKGDLYNLEWAYWIGATGEWWGPGLGEVMYIRRVPDVPKM